jgi:polyisoprenoid-binding protein YceI
MVVKTTIQRYPIQRRAAMSQAATRTIEGLEAPAPGTWKFDHDHTKLSAVARHMMVTKVRGYFNDVSGTIQVAERPEDSSVEVTIQAASIDTGVQQRDDHLRSADFMDVERFPTITFKSTKIEHLGGPNLRVTGDLTIRGVTRPITLDVEYLGVEKAPWGDDTRIGFSAAGELDREAFGMTWNAALETGGVLVSKRFHLELDVQARLESIELPA